MSLDFNTSRRLDQKSLLIVGTNSFTEEICKALQELNTMLIDKLGTLSMERITIKKKELLGGIDQIPVNGNHGISLSGMGNYDHLIREHNGQEEIADKIIAHLEKLKIKDPMKIQEIMNKKIFITSDIFNETNKPEYAENLGIPLSHLISRGEGSIHKQLFEALFPGVEVTVKSYSITV